MSKIVLCTTSFPQASRHTLEMAAQLAKDQHAHLTVLFTYRLNQQKNGEAVGVKKETERDAAAYFAILEKEVLKGMGIPYNFRTEIGFMTDRIRANMLETPVDFVVIDKAVNIENKDSFSELLDRLNIPVLIVP
jgi:hypothetical protein